MDSGPATGTPEFQAGSTTVASIFLEVHTANGALTAASSGVPGGLPGVASGNNNLPPTGFSGVPSPTAYGTVSNGNAVTPIFLNLQGTLPTPTSVIKNPA